MLHTRCTYVYTYKYKYLILIHLTIQNSFWPCWVIIKMKSEARHTTMLVRIHSYSYSYFRGKKAFHSSLLLVL